MMKDKKKPLINCIDLNNCESCSRKILFWTIVGNVFLAVIKLIGGTLSKSSGLMADGLQSISCVIASIIIMYSLIIARKKNDDRFPYGYAKIEFIVALVVFSILVGLGLFIAITSLLLILQRNMTPPGIIGLPMAVTSAFLTYMMYKYNVCAGKNLESPGLIANGYQARADMFSSIAVTIGILLSQISPSFAIFDRLAAFWVGCMILKDAFEHWIINFKVILDKVPEPSYRAKIKSAVSQIFDGPVPKNIKLKRTGKNFWIGIGLNFPDTGNVQEMCTIAAKIRKQLRQEIHWVGEVDFFLEK